MEPFMYPRAFLISDCAWYLNITSQTISIPPGQDPSLSQVTPQLSPVPTVYSRVERSKYDLNPYCINYRIWVQRPGLLVHKFLITDFTKDESLTSKYEAFNTINAQIKMWIYLLPVSSCDNSFVPLFKPRCGVSGRIWNIEEYYKT